MSYKRFTVMPQHGEEVSIAGFLDPNGIVAFDVAPTTHIQFAPEDHEFAVRYLTKIADEARKLAQQITEAHPEQQS